jgi:hypothetical protein
MENPSEAMAPVPALLMLLATILAAREERYCRRRGMNSWRVSSLRYRTDMHIPFEALS